MSEPKFKPGDKAQREIDSGAWVQVTIKSCALSWAHLDYPEGRLYLVQYDDTSRGEQRFLAHEVRLRPADQWEPCPGTHRPIGYAGGFTHDKLERRVE